MDTDRPRIIIKKKGGHGGHHGGAWKVAYADFVTAMMALFIVLWLLNTSKQVQDAVGGYFKDPSGTSKLAGTALKGSGDNVAITKDNMAELKQELQKAIQKVNNFDKLSKQIEMTVTSEGLRIELIETATGTFFDIGDPHPNQNGKELLAALAEEIGKVPNHVSIEGHTDSKPYGGEGYSNWELSVDRANYARRIMSSSGLAPNQVAQVRGYADRRLRYKDDPENPGNRRISVIVQYWEKETPSEELLKPHQTGPPQSSTATSSPTQSSTSTASHPEP
jgi:chemotaxis protein MotB